MINPDLEREITRIGGDSGLVRLILASEGVVGVHQQRALSAQDERQSFRGNAGRRLKREAGPEYRDLIVNRRKMGRVMLEKTLFSIQPAPPKRRGEQEKRPRWRAACLLRQYFVRLTKRPHIGLIAKIVSPDIDYDSFKRGFAKHRRQVKAELAAESSVMCLDGKGIKSWTKLEYYEELLKRAQERHDETRTRDCENEVKFFDVLRTGKPIYELLRAYP